MKNVLFAWIGDDDLRAPWADAKLTGPRFIDRGPLAYATRDIKFHTLVLLTPQPTEISDGYVAWLKKKTKARIDCHNIVLTSSSHFGDIYENAVSILERYLAIEKDKLNCFFHLSAGTPAMIAVWVLLAKTRFPGEMIEFQKGKTEKVSIPFDIYADYIPDFLKKKDDEWMRLSQGLLTPSPEFEAIIHRSEIMKRLVARAQKVAQRNLPVLIQGESGTGKDLLARAIHKVSTYREGPFIAVNCGAIPSELVESELFGHEKGAFTGADRPHVGYIEASHSGTLFLDEIGELPLSVQVKLLRVLQEKQVIRLGSTKPVQLDMRIISATNRNLIEEVVQGRFREDLFHRLAVAILYSPPLREREGDIGLLVDYLLEQINRDATGQPGFEKKSLSASARKMALRHYWPGNVRDLQNTLLRAAIWSVGPKITEQDLKDAMLPLYQTGDGNILDQPLGEGLQIQDVLDDVTSHYIERALKESGGNKSKAAKLLGLANYQTLNNWMSRLERDSAT